MNWQEWFIGHKMIDWERILGTTVPRCIYIASLPVENSWGERLSVSQRDIFLERPGVWGSPSWVQSKPGQQLRPKGALAYQLSSRVCAPLLLSCLLSSSTAVCSSRADTASCGDKGRCIYLSTMARIKRFLRVWPSQWTEGKTDWSGEESTQAHL